VTGRRQAQVGAAVPDAAPRRTVEPPERFRYGSTVPTLTLKGLPAEVHRRLKERAARHGRSLNGEAIACLRAAVTAEVVDVDDLLARARAHRQAIRQRLRDNDVRVLKREGRP